MSVEGCNDCRYNASLLGRAVSLARPMGKNVPEKAEGQEIVEENAKDMQRCGGTDHPALPNSQMFAGHDLTCW